MSINNTTFTIEEFSNRLSKAVIARMPEEEQRLISGKVRKIRKNNGVLLHGVNFMNEATGVAPIVYVDKMYERFCNGESMESLANEVLAVVTEHKDDIKELPDGIMDFESVKGRIVPKLINAERNQELLFETPHALIGDLAVIFLIKMDSIENGECGKEFGTVTINENLQKTWEVDTERIMSTAIGNISGAGIRISSLASVINNILAGGLSGEEEADPSAYVLTMGNGTFGASGVLETETMLRFAEDVDSDLYVLPSSIHELILIPCSHYGENAEGLLNMVKEVNRTVVSDEDFLADNVYRFNREEKALSYALTGEMITLKAA